VAGGSSAREYGADLAVAHHEGFAGVAQHAAESALLELGRRFERGLLVDLGCGTGVLARVITDAGYDVTGVDISPSMLDLARDHAPKAQFVESSLLDFVLPPCEAVTAVGEAVNYGFDRHAGLNRLGDLFARAYDALVPGGFFLLDVAGPGRVRGGSARTFVDTGDWAVAAYSIESDDHTELTRTITTFRRAGDLYRRTDEVHRQHLYRGADIEHLLRAAGFTVRRRRGYGDLRYAHGTNVFLAGKRR
jgi:SAM-dependent methyltransferase